MCRSNKRTKNRIRCSKSKNNNTRGINGKNNNTSRILCSRLNSNSFQLLDDAVTADKLAANSVVFASIVNGTITTADLADDAVTHKIADDAVKIDQLQQILLFPQV